MKTIERLRRITRDLSSWLEGYVVLIFALLGLVLMLVFVSHWLLVLKPTLRAEAESRAAVLAQSQIQSLEQILVQYQDSERLQPELLSALGKILLFKDASTQEHFIQRITLMFDYDLLRLPPGSLDLDLGNIACQRCFVSRIPLYHPEDRQLIGVATCYSSPRFLDDLSANLVHPLLWVGGLILLLIGYAWFQTQRFLHRVRESEHNLRAVFEAAPFPMLLQAANDPLPLRANAAAIRYLALRETANGDLDSAAWRELAHAALPNQAGKTCEISFNGLVHDQTHWALASSVSLRFSGTMSRLIGLADISALKAIEEELRTTSFTDALTGLYNRRYLYQQLAHEIELAGRYHHPLSIILFDLDFFKRVNDTFGHNVGDDVLVCVSGVLQSCIREVDTAGRHGGEEFLVILPHADLDKATEVAERIRDSVAKIEWSVPDLEMSISGGVAQHCGEHLDAWIDVADRRLYMAKHAGRNRVLSSPVGVS